MRQFLKTAALTCAFALFTLGAGACASKSDTDKGGSNDNRVVVKATSNAKTAATNANAFGFRLFNEVLKKSKPGENVAVSGVSAAVALALFREACEGESRKVVTNTLGFGGKPDTDAAQAFSDMAAVLNGKSEAIVHMANTMFTKQGIEFNKEFMEIASKSFGADAKSRDMSDPKTLSELNGWVKDKTNGMIPTMLDEIDPMTFAIILNALYFHGMWETEFKASQTAQRDFTPEVGDPFKVDMMNTEVKAVVSQSATTGMARLPYKGGDYSMVLMMPLYGKKLAETRAELATDGVWADWWKRLSGETIEHTVSMPKFKIEATHDLNGPLTSLGMGHALEAGKADYSRMAKGMDAKAQVAANVKQKVVVEVDEKGTKAAAVTSIEMRVTSVRDQFYPNFDRPFMFAIVEHQTGAVLFLGQINDPRAK